MGLREYARHRGVSLTAVQKACAQGRISKLQDGKIDPEAADQAWKRNTVNPKLPAPVAAPGPEPKKAATVVQPQIVDAEEPGSLVAWRAKREQFAAKKAELDYLERTGELIDRDQIKTAAFQRGRVVREALLSIPDRVAALIASKTNTAEVHKILTDEITAAIRELTREPAVAA